MMVGMVALAPLWQVAWPGLAAHPDLETLTMALDMTLAMAAGCACAATRGGTSRGCPPR